MPTSSRARLLCALAFAATACGKQTPPAPPPEPSEHSLSGIAAQHVAVLPTYSVRVMPGLDWAGAIGRLQDVKQTLDADILSAFDERGLRKAWIFPADLLAAYKRNSTYAADPYELAEEPLRSPSLALDALVPDPLAAQLRTLIAFHKTRDRPRAGRAAIREGGHGCAACFDWCSSIRVWPTFVGSARSERHRGDIRPSHLGEPRGETGERGEHAVTRRHTTYFPECRDKPLLIPATVSAVDRQRHGAHCGGRCRHRMGYAGAGLAGVARFGDPIPEATLDSIKRTKLALKGPLETPVGEGYRSINVALRKTFDLYANVRPAYSIAPGGRYENLDLVMIRENTEGLYVGVEHYIKVGDDPRAAAESIAIITRQGSERIVRYAFDYAVKHGRKKVTLVHKANILKFSQGLFLDTGRMVARDFAGRVEFEERIVDAMAMNLVLHPERFDVIVTTNLFGDILSDQISGLVGGLGLAPGANIGVNGAIFEAVHGTAPDIAGKGIANPGALVLAACMMLDHIDDLSARSEFAPPSRARFAMAVTRDLGGTASTDQFTDAVIAKL
jgi:isocitrate dehydrogenase (NAD+)